MKPQISEYLAVNEASTEMTHFFFSSKADAASFSEAADADVVDVIAGLRGKSVSLKRVSIAEERVDEVLGAVKITGYPRVFVKQDVLDVKALSNSVALLSAGQGPADEIYR